MSAAEKLERLEAAMVAAEKPWLATIEEIALSDAAISDLAEALSQIVAVVKAAERAVLVSACDYPEGACENECGRGGDNFDARIDCVRIQALQALDALDEALL